LHGAILPAFGLNTTIRVVDDVLLACRNDPERIVVIQSPMTPGDRRARLSDRT
jgi:hypothetical protein